MTAEPRSDPRTSSSADAGDASTSFELVWTADGGVGDGGWDLPERFELARDLGDAPLGPVFVVRDTTRGGAALRLEIASSSATPTDAERAALEEALRAAARVESEYVARCVEVGRLGDGRVFALREHSAGESLAERLAREGALHPDHALEIGRQLARGLEALHGAGLAHGALGARSVWLASHAPKTDANPFGVRVQLLDSGAARRALGEGPDADLRSVGELLAAMLGARRNDSARSEAAHALAEALRADGASAFASAEQVRRALDELLVRPLASDTHRETHAPRATQRLSSDARAAAPERTLAFKIAVAAAVIGLSSAAWLAWKRDGAVQAAEKSAADARTQFERAQHESKQRIDALGAELSNAQQALERASGELAATRESARNELAASEGELGRTRTELESERQRATQLAQGLETTREQLRSAQSRLEESLGRSDPSIRAARGLDAALALIEDGQAAQALRQAQLLESEGLFGPRQHFVSSLAAGFDGLERFAASRGADPVATADVGAVAEAERALALAREQRALFTEDSSAWLGMELVDAPAKTRVERIDGALARLGDGVQSGLRERAALHERDWAAILGASGLQDPVRAFRHAERFTCEHLDELCLRFAREVRARTLVDDGLDVGRLASFDQLGQWAARVRRGEVRLPDDLARDLRLLADAQRWYDQDESNDADLGFAELRATGHATPRKAWRDELALQWQLAGEASSFPLRVGQRAWRVSIDPSGQREWWRESVEGVDGLGLKLRRARFSADGRTALGEGVLRIERRGDIFAIAGSTLPLIDLRAHGESVKVSATPIEAAVELPEALGATPDLEAQLRSAAERDACLVYTQGAVRRWFSPRLGLVREETRTSEGVAVTQLVGLEQR